MINTTEMNKHDLKQNMNMFNVIKWLNCMNIFGFVIIWKLLGGVRSCMDLKGTLKIKWVVMKWIRAS